MRASTIRGRVLRLLALVAVVVTLLAGAVPRATYTAASGAIATYVAEVAGSREAEPPRAEAPAPRRAAFAWIDARLPRPEAPAFAPIVLRLYQRLCVLRN